jgi:4-hydroxybenzoyl-CoA thioesterase
MPIRSENLIAWGDCDSAGIVYFPKYFHFIDIAFQALMHKAGFDHRRLLSEFGVRLPIIDAGAKFTGPATYDDRLAVDAEVIHWGKTSFKVEYRGSRAGAPVFEAYEVRVWAKIATDGAISTVPIAPQFKAAFTAAGRGDK